MVIGDGDFRERYQIEAITLGLESSVSFVGRISHPELPAYFAASDVVVLPSTQPESFGMVIIEAMACGKPVICSRIPGVRSLINEGIDGMLFKPGNAIDLEAKLKEMFTLSVEERQRMGNAGRRKAEERFSWKSIGVRLESIYNQVLVR